MNESRFVPLDNDDIAKLTTHQVKPNTQKVYNQFIRLFESFCKTKSDGLFDALPTLRNTDIEDLVCEYIGSARKQNQ